jgi:Xaa-Pro aminopeptidase
MTVPRIAGVRRALSAQQLDAIVITQPDNRRYLSGFTGSAGWLIITPQQQIIIGDSRYWERIGKEAPHFELVKHTTRPEQLEKLRETLQSLKAKKVGFEAEHVTVAQHAKWKEELKDIELVATTEVIEQLRAHKDAQELATLRRALALTDNAYKHIRHWIEPGMTEREVAWELEVFMRTHGAEGLAFEVGVASGPDSAEPHHHSGDRRIQWRDPIWIDMGAKVDGYCADLTRSFTLGEPDDQFKKIYAIVLRAQLAAIAALKAGVSGKDADAIARQVIEDAGYGENFGHGLGHGLGLFIHEKPSAGKASEDTLNEGALLTVEPGIYIPGWGGIRIEDVVLIKADGVEVLTQAPK